MQWQRLEHAGGKHSVHSSKSTTATLSAVNLPPLMERTIGRPEVMIGLLDGPVALDHPDLAIGQIREVPGRLRGRCADPTSSACVHGTFVAGMLCAKRESCAPSICPGCTLLLCPIFGEASRSEPWPPSATPTELAAAIVDSINAGARVLNLSAAFAQLSSRPDRHLDEALDYAARHGVIVVAAAGNQGTLGSSQVTRHPWVIPVVAQDVSGQPLQLSNLARSMAIRGLGAPGQITSLGTTGQPLTLTGTSFATALVTGTIALLWSEFPLATAGELRLAVTRGYASRRRTVLPLGLDAWASYNILLTVTAKGDASL